MTYKLYISNAGAPATGLTPSWGTLKKVADGKNYTPQPSITEIGGGWYKFDYAGSIDLVGVIDGGSSLSGIDRYVPLDVSPIDWDIAKDSDILAINTILIDVRDAMLGDRDVDLAAKTETYRRPDGTVQKVFNLRVATSNVPAFIARTGA